MQQNRRRPVWRPVALAAVGASVLVATGVGVWATLTATAANVTPEQVSSGTLKLTLANSGAGFSQNITNLAPGDTVNRYVALTNGGTLDAQALTLQVNATGANALISDSGTGKALRVTVTECVGAAWTPDTGACGGTKAVLLAATPLNGLASAVSLPAGAMVAGDVQNLQVSVQLPDQNETTVNGALPASTVQGQSVNLTYTFAETQRTAQTTTS